MKTNEVPLQLIIPKDAKTALETMAEREGIKSVSELIRRLLENYCRHNGLDVDFNVGTWGGRRVKDSGEIKSQEADDRLQPIEIQRLDGRLTVTLADGRTIAHPLAWYPFLVAATQDQFNNRTATPLGIYWPDLEDGISIEMLIMGPASDRAQAAKTG